MDGILHATEELKSAIKKPSHDGVVQALSKGADPKGVCGSKGETPLHFASMYGNEEIMKELIRHGADINSRNNDGKTPLICLTSDILKKASGWRHRARLLVEAEADITIKDKEKRTAGEHHLRLLEIHCEKKGLLTSDNVDLAEDFLLLKDLCKLDDDSVKKMIYDMVDNASHRADKVYQMFTEGWSQVGVLECLSSIPEEIKALDPEAVKVFCRSMQEGKGKRYCLQFHVVGHYEAGKTSLIKQLLKENFSQKDVEPTNGVDVYVGLCDIDIDDEDWHRNETSSVEDRRLDQVIDCMNSMKLKEKPCSMTTSASNTADDEQTSPLTSLGQEEPAGSGHEKTSGSDYEVIYSRENLGKDPHLKTFFSKVHNKKSECRKALVRGVDFGGHCLFYTTHQVFLTRRGINIIVINIARKLDDLVEDDDFRHLGIRQKAKVKDFIKFWIKTLKHFTDGEHQRIFIVATHKDKATEEEIDLRIREVKELLKESKMDNLVMPEIFCVNSYDSSDEAIIALRKKLVMTAKMDTENWGIELPIKWLYLEDLIHKFYRQGKKQIMTLEEIRDINEQSNIIGSEQELKQFLCFHHKIGTFLFYHEHGVSDLVVLDPQWMIDSLKEIITFRKKDMTPKLQKDLYEKGLLCRNFIQKVWEPNSDFWEHQDRLLTLLEKLNIFIGPMKYDSEGNRDPDTSLPYIVPCMLRTASEDFIEEQMKKNEAKSSALVFVFEEMDFLPIIFHRLLASCMASLIQDFDRCSVFCDKAEFPYSGSHCLLLQSSSRSIMAHIVCRDGGCVNSDIGYSARQFLEETLSGILGNKKNEMRTMILCNRLSKSDTDNGLFSIKELETEKKDTIKCTCSDHSVNVQQILKAWTTNLEMGDVEMSPVWEASSIPVNLNETPIKHFWLGRATMNINPKISKQLALALNLDENAQAEIDVDHPHSVYDRLYHILFKWSKNNPESSMDDLVKAVEKTGKNLDLEKLSKTKTSWREGVPDDVLKRTVSDCDIDGEFSRVTGPLFFRLGIELHIDHYTLNNIQGKSQEKAKQMLHEWKKMRRSNATYREFGDAACNVGLGEGTVKLMTDR